MRARNIKPAFFKNELLADCSPHARLLFIGLWCLADWRGCLEYRPKRIGAEIFPYEDIDVDELITVLEQYQFVSRYELGPNRYCKILNFQRHQSPVKKERDQGAKFPDMPDTYKSTVPGQYQHGTGTVPVALIPDSLNLKPDNGNLTDSTFFGPQFAHAQRFIDAYAAEFGIDIPYKHRATIATIDQNVITCEIDGPVDWSAYLHDARRHNLAKDWAPQTLSKPQHVESWLRGEWKTKDKEIEVPM